MVEIPKDCVLQWAGHAGYITERFSGLLARQALVDVTLVCDEQKLRVHKLVLASNSIYFEEILQQDLGQEPIILLKDLDFKILKAMVEFMYCGETTISHQHLSSLLVAAKIFKVKELVSVIDTIVGTKKTLDNFGDCLKQQRGDCSLKVNNFVANNLTENDYVRVRCDKLSMDENTSICADSNNDMSSTKTQSLENEMIDGTEHDSEDTLYEESDIIDANRKAVDTSLFSISNVNISQQGDNTTNNVSTIGKVNEVQTRCVCGNRDEIYCNSHDLKPILYEQCCDFSDVNECDQTSSATSLSQSCLPQVENDFEHHSGGSNTDVPSSKVGKCVKVYTHKRRRSVDEVRNKLVHTCNLVPIPPSSTDSIDLLDEPSANDIPVTMLTSLDMESAEYILSLSTESIQSIVGGTISDQHTVIGCKELNTVRNGHKERSNLAIDANYVKPVLRRSTRLNQQESDDVASNDLSSGSPAGIEKSFRKSNSPNGMESYAKAKRKGRDDRKVPDHGIIDAQSKSYSIKKSFKNKRSNSKMMVRKSNKSTCAVANGKEKEESKPKVMNSRFKTENTERWMMSDRTVLPSIKSDTISGINRALWGDISDGWQNEINLLAYPSNTEIPFAVGLLPLRAALEKMQATPDYQPRKTRSSVAPMKQDTINNLKRKANYTSSDIVMSKKTNGNNNESPKTTVCHIQIKTTSSQDIKNRKSRFLPDSITNLPTTEVMNRQ